jgi:signal transduction histidine kinase
VDAVLFLARRRELPFDTDDANLLSEFATIAALLLRNARLLRSAEAASIAKSSFLNLAAHELRTPVSVIRGYLDLLASGDFGSLAESQRQALETVTTKAVELAEQLEQLLIASRLDVPVAPDSPRSERIDLGSLVAEAVSRAGPRAKLLRASVDLVAAASVKALGSATEVGLVVDNLINNAITYSRPPARVRVEVASDGVPVVRVSDHGIGIPAEEQGRIFEQFHRVDRPDFAYPGGTGLGLFIARQLAGANGGSVELEWSEVDKGSSFVLRLRPAET